MSTVNDTRRQVERIVDALWSDYAIDQTAKGHFRVTFRHKGKSRTVFHSGTPGDCRAILNFKTKARRTLRALKEATS